MKMKQTEKEQWPMHNRNTIQKPLTGKKFLQTYAQLCIHKTNVSISFEGF